MIFMSKRLSLSKYVTEFLSPKIIFAIDLSFSLLASGIALFPGLFLFDPSNITLAVAVTWMCGSLVFSFFSMLLFRTYKVIVRHTTLRDMANYVIAFIVKDLLILSLMWPLGWVDASIIVALVVDVILSVFLIICIRIFMVQVFDSYRTRKGEFNNQQRVLVFGTSDKSVSSITRFQNSSHYKVVGFLSSNRHERNLKLSEYPVFVYNDDEELKKIAKSISLNAILFSTEADAQKEQNGLISFCLKNNIKTLISPSVDEVIGGRFMKSRIREVKIEDLLGRSEIKISMDAIKDYFKGKVVLVTGAAGSIGSELCRQLAGFGIKQLILFDNAETPMHNLRLELEARFPMLDFVPVIGSVRHVPRLDYVFRTWKPQVVFHAAAYKHVPLMEENPCEAVFANVYGSRNVADKSLEYNVEMMVMISTDKAVNPTNIMGCSKRLAEIYVQSLGLAIEQGKIKGNTKFVTTRFGNVLGSNGSVIPRFREQIQNGGPVTVTHPDITRFFMTIPEACRLVMEAATMSDGNQIFVFDMGESVKIADLAKRMIKLAGLKLGEDIEIEYTGLRPGEKLYEEVLANSEDTEPTSHDRIRIAKVRQYDYEDAAKACDELAALSKQVRISEMVQLMKKIVPEFKSKNSIFEMYDKMGGGNINS
jgi:FlaA1/EpsC-like NDP-sugar epimerase